MAYREVRVFEVREVLRLWIRGEGLRAIERLAGIDRKTARRVRGPHRHSGHGQAVSKVAAWSWVARKWPSRALIRAGRVQLRVGQRQRVGEPAKSADLSPNTHWGVRRKQELSEKKSNP